MFLFLADIKLTNFAAKNTHILTNYIEHFDWNKMISSFLSTVFSLAVISVLFFLIHAIGKKLIKRSFAGARAKSSTVSQGRIETIYTLSQNIFHYCVLFFYLYAVLSIFGVPVSTLLASAGIVSAHSSASTANSDQIRFIIRLLNAKMQFLCEIFIKTIYHPCADGKSFYKKHKKQDPRP